MHLRLYEIFNSSEILGGVSVVVFADLLQLPAVKGNSVFMPVSCLEAKQRIGCEGSAPRGAAASSSAMAFAVTLSRGASPNRGTQSYNWAKIPGDRNRPRLVYRKPVYAGSECAAK